jgi:hypothetical protein
MRTCFPIDHPLIELDKNERKTRHVIFFNRPTAQRDVIKNRLRVEREMKSWFTRSHREKPKTTDHVSSIIRVLSEPVFLFNWIISVRHYPHIKNDMLNQEKIHFFDRFGFYVSSKKNLYIPILDWYLMRKIYWSIKKMAR